MNLHFIVRQVQDHNSHSHRTQYMPAQMAIVNTPIRDYRPAAYILHERAERRFSSRSPAPELERITLISEVAKAASEPASKTSLGGTGTDQIDF